ncbi:MAG: hypothetical protein Tsb009_08310 [Planctomycetaceae bacterium]
MDSNANCPRCGELLKADTSAPDLLGCLQCGGNFIPASQLEMNPAEEQPARNSSSQVESHSDAELLNCPCCQMAMTPLTFDSAVLFHCSQCDGVWADAVVPEEPSNENEEASSGLTDRGISRYLFYSLTLPERVLRSTVGATAGIARESAGFLVPSAFQNSKTYEVVIKNSLNFLAEDIGGVQPQTDGPKLGKDFVARKAVGNFVDMAGWATLAFSPVWVMAIVSDVAYGSKSYLNELANELKSQGLIDKNSTINRVEDVLAAVQNATGKAATLVDTPPLSVDQLKETLDETRKAIASTNYLDVLPQSELKNYWNEMKEISKRENVGLIGVSGALTMHTLGKLRNASVGAFTGVKIAGGIFNRNVVGHYVDSLKTVRERGFYQTLRESSIPYIEAIWNNFSQDRTTWTEELITGRAIGRAFKAVTGFFKRDRKTDVRETTGSANSEQPGTNPEEETQS